MRYAPTRPRRLLGLLAALLTASLVSACGSVTGPTEPAAKKALAPGRLAHADGTPADTAGRTPVQPWY
jgi:hypothetical protein